MVSPSARATRIVPALLLASLALAACDDAPPTVGLDAALDGPLQPTDTAASALRESEIVGLLISSNEGQIAEGELAQRLGADPRVRTFGATMVSMHTASNARLVDLRMRLGIKPEVSPLGQMLTDDVDATRAALAAFTGAAFDRAYAAAQVRQHGRLLDVVNSALVPNATSPELRDALTRDVATMEAAHVEQARALQTALDTP